MIAKLKTVWRFILSFEGLILIVLLLVSLSLYYFGFTDISLIISIIDLLLAIIIVIKIKLSEISLIEKKVNELNVTLDKISNNDIINYKPIDKNIVLNWKNEMLAYAKKEFIKNIGTNEDALVRYSLDKWINLFNLNNQAQNDFLKYLSFILIYPSEKDINLILNNYTKNVIPNNTKKLFLSYIYAYFIEYKTDIKELFKNQLNYTEDQLSKALFFLKNSLDEVNSILDRIAKLTKIEEKEKYLEKLNEEIREYLHTKGVSLDKYGEVFLSQLNNAYLIIQQKLGEKLKEKLKISNVKNLPLYFTGPYLIISNDIKSTQELKQKLDLAPRPSESHNLLIVRILPSDSYISTGIDRKSKKSSKKQLKKIKNVFENVGEISATTKHYALILDKPLQEFVESLHFDFLIISKIPSNLKESLRSKTKEIKDKLSKITKTQIKNLTDVYNVSENDLLNALKEVELSNGNLNKISKEIINGANTWRYLLYGYKTEVQK